ncbi:hypothetical protein QP166_11885 [Sphingomonas sp. LR60]|uniref:hypothetical protein n=1 Tax=Sphingomonas sp. LR60 TaxID=3050233 RepID=UPI002FE2950D
MNLIKTVDLGRLSEEELDLVFEFIELLKDRPISASTMPVHLQRRESIGRVISMLDLARRACGASTVRLAYGDPATSREEGLIALAERARLASYAFGTIDFGHGSLSEVESEARAVSQSDLPRVFAKLGNRKKTVRLLQAKFTALRWDFWLAGRGLEGPERRSKIANAFGAEWETIARRWKDDVVNAWGDEALVRLRGDQRDAENGLRIDRMRRNEDWHAALARDGQRYQAQLRER